jgi:protein gp37
LYLNLQSRLIAAGLDYQLPESAVRILAEVPWTAENPLPNVWIGTSTEDQRRFDERLPDLLATPAAVRFLSMEPLLGAVEMPLGLGARGLNWVIVGGESGPGARPMHPDWARALRDHCVLDKVPFFFKQWGGVNKKKAGRLLDGRTYDEMPAAAKVAA